MKDLKKAAIQEQYSNYYLSPTLSSVSTISDCRSPIHLDLMDEIYVCNANVKDNIQESKSFSIESTKIPLNLPIINKNAEITSSVQSSQLQLLNYFDEDSILAMRSNSVILNYELLLNDHNNNIPRSSLSNIFNRSSSILSKRKISNCTMEDDNLLTNKKFCSENILYNEYLY